MSNLLKKLNYINCFIVGIFGGIGIFNLFLSTILLLDSKGEIFQFNYGVLIQCSITLFF